MESTPSPLVTLIAVCECGTDMVHKARTTLPYYHLHEGELRMVDAGLVVDLEVCPSCGQNQVRCIPVAPTGAMAGEGDALA
jgi:hypothetical protein